MDNCKLCGANTFWRNVTDHFFVQYLRTVSSPIKEAIISALSNERDLDYDAASRNLAEGYICWLCWRVVGKSVFNPATT